MHKYYKFQFNLKLLMRLNCANHEIKQVNERLDDVKLFNFCIIIIQVKHSHGALHKSLKQNACTEPILPSFLLASNELAYKYFRCINWCN